MSKHYLTWYKKEDNGVFEGEIELINISSEELERLQLFNSTFTIYPVKTLEQFNYLASFITFSFLSDEYDYFVEYH